MFRVKRHWFWPQFVDGWEEETCRFYREHVDPKRPVLDLGSWIGPTALFAAAFGAQKIVAVEANPRTVEHLLATKTANPNVLGGLAVHNGVIHKNSDLVTFGNMDGSESTSSASSTRGSGFSVQGTTIASIIERYSLKDVAVIKIDIEGSELDVRNQITKLSKLNAALLVSLHPPFWSSQPLEKSAGQIVRALRPFKVTSVDGKSLSEEDLKAMITYSGTTPPAWGTPFGNFFEVILKPKGTFGRFVARLMPGAC